MFDNGRGTGTGLVSDAGSALPVQVADKLALMGLSLRLGPVSNRVVAVMITGR